MIEEALLRHEKITVRYGQILASGRRELRDLLSESELKLVLDSCNGMFFADGQHFQYLNGNAIALNVGDSIRLNKLHKKWVVDAAALMRKLDGLSCAALYAFVDIIERFWDDVGNHADKDPLEYLK